MGNLKRINPERLSFFGIYFWILLFGMASSTLGSMQESADPPAFGSEHAILSAVPPLDFSVDPRLQKNVRFWVQVYSVYTSNQGLIHDAKYIDHVYEVLNFTDLNQKNTRDGLSQTRAVKTSKRKWKEVLLSVHRKQNRPETFTAEEQRIFDLFKDIDEPHKFLNAAHRRRLRFQLGQKDRFLEGLYQSGYFISKMEDIFKKDGMPMELTRLPFVESSFNPMARSKVGASGIWQFMRSTGRLFIKVNDAVDERNDPIRATVGAAKLLRLNYESLKSWPLAVTAYNHGRKGMMRAVRRVGSDELEKVVAEYHHRSFGFASGNFFTELLAAIEVEKNAEKYFGKVKRAEPLDYVEVQLPDFMDVRELVRREHLNPHEFKVLNPALTDAVYKGRLLVPSGYTLRIPCAVGQTKDLILKNFFSTYEQIPSAFKLRAQPGLKYDTKARSLRRRIKNRTSLPQGSGRRYAFLS